MKKTILAVLVVLLALLAVTCNNGLLAPGAVNKVDGGGDEPVPDGFVRISIGIGEGRGRAMSGTLNTAEVDFYEVVFKKGNTVVKSTADWNGTQLTPEGGSLGNTWTVIVPVGDYNPVTGDTDAVLFAGRKTDKMLIGIGVITDTNDGSSTGTAVIDGDTVSITFTLSAITSNITTDLLIQDSTPATIGISPNGINANSTTYTGFKLDNDEEYTAEYTFHVPYTKLITTGTPSVDIDDTNGDEVIELSDIAKGSSSVLNSATATGSVIVEFTIATDEDDTGVDFISIEVPAWAINQAAGGAEWVIQGGQNNTTADNGINIGGAVVIQVGFDMQPISIGPPASL